MTLVCLLIAAGKVSGAHFNPSISIGIYIEEWKWGYHAKLFIIILLAQFSGAFLGMGWALLAQQNRLDFTIPLRDYYGTVDPSYIPVMCPKNLDGTCSNDNRIAWQSFAVEATCTFVFVMVNLIVKYKPQSPSEDSFLNCLGIALGLGSMIRLSGPYSGACLNPAVAIAQLVYVVT
eukprot:CAMPEP_0176355690 /NCGR_PEP_ID=MMETSP0126-20121128/13470_1 /TAXON_ID=141414 ORGANISM="Strombidinopsis acuminatum, Strain SPMC142" /NCGR_SAMPLE_ID=MMETSP0126 /ASSEMBLY_ACC=CAM_ASM_000229 /LENGTH=175 /DNA_ID=CAMNT_0017708439 /DNA_START=156 /DNA_END=683 /DNA_ORIENTATION=-